jgi:hypothetical protein
MFAATREIPNGSVSPMGNLGKSNVRMDIGHATFDKKSIQTTLHLYSGVSIVSNEKGIQVPAAFSL